MTIANVEYLQQRAANHRNNEVRRFAPFIPEVINVLTGAGISVSKRYTNQILIAGRYIGKFEHTLLIPLRQARLAIYDSLHYGEDPIITIHNAREAELFVQTFKWARRIR